MKSLKPRRENEEIDYNDMITSAEHKLWRDNPKGDYECPWCGMKFTQLADKLTHGDPSLRMCENYDYDNHRVKKGET